MIRTAKTEDAAALQKLYVFLQPEDPVSTAEEFEATLAEILTTGKNMLFVYEIDDEIVSTCYLNILPNLTRNLRPYAVIENVVTNPDHRGKGYATALLREAMDTARDQGCYKVMLLTGSKRESTLRFYEKAGLKIGEKTAFHTRL
ncbi:MAG: GNAT family N-acetyltransferase [Candidatus Latescibacteria bacterium]|nr:GNAT family N-acetyltransferase [Candidatus Latescibacterota bacterium]